MKLEEKLQKLSEDIESVKADQHQRFPKKDQNNNLYIDFVSYILVGVLLGMGIDELFDFSPYGLIVTLLLSFVVAIYKIYKNI